MWTIQFQHCGWNAGRWYWGLTLKRRLLGSRFRHAISQDTQLVDMSKAGRSDLSLCIFSNMSRWTFGRKVLWDHSPTSSKRIDNSWDPCRCVAWDYSFIHARSRTPCVTRTNEILRSYKCRLLFLSGSRSVFGGLSVPPLCWRTLKFNDIGQPSTCGLGPMKALIPYWSSVISYSPSHCFHPDQEV